MKWKPCSWQVHEALDYWQVFNDTVLPWFSNHDKPHKTWWLAQKGMMDALNPRRWGVNKINFSKVGINNFKTVTFSSTKLLFGLCSCSKWIPDPAQSLFTSFVYADSDRSVTGYIACIGLLFTVQACLPVLWGWVTMSLPAGLLDNSTKLTL